MLEVGYCIGTVSTAAGEVGSKPEDGVVCHLLGIYRVPRTFTHI